MRFGDDLYPVFDEVTKEVECETTREGYVYAPLYRSDDFSGNTLDGAWEFNHNPVDSHWRLSDGLVIDALPAPAFDMAKNTLTQRALWDACEAEVTVDAGSLPVGGFAGLAALQYRYGALGIERLENGLRIALKLRDDGEEYLADSVDTASEKARLKVKYEFGHGKDFAEFYALVNGEWKQLGGRHKMIFDLKHFTGCRFGLFCYTTGSEGGSAKFNDFVYNDYGNR